MSEKIKTHRGWKILRRILIALAILVTLIAVLYAEEDWRGRRDWENYKQQLEAKGEVLDWHKFVPPAVPDAENFFTSPIFAKIKNDKISMTPYGNDGGPDFSYKNLPSSQTGYLGAEGRTSITDLKAWQNYYRNPTNLHINIEFVKTNSAFVEQTNYSNHPSNEFPIAPQPQTPAKAVLFALSKFDSAVEDLRQASQRPYANVPLNYEDGFNSASTLLPILADLKRCTQLLQLRADAELADGENEKALADVKLLVYLNNSLRNSPFLICHLVRIAVVAYDLQPIWEGLAKREWSDEQLVALETELGKLDFLADYEFAMRGERAFAIASFENQRRTHEVIVPLENGGSMTLKMTWMPSAYFYQNELAIARMQQHWILPLVDTNSRVISPEKLRQSENTFHAEKKHYSPYTIQALMVFPATGRAVEKFAIIQSSVDLARVACALERYHLANENYPETLDALAPKFIEKIPHDIINGQPLHYRRTDDGKFLLYSVGWNETDDGGNVVLNKSDSVDREKGDWLWQYPAK